MDAQTGCSLSRIVVTNHTKFLTTEAKEINAKMQRCEGAKGKFLQKETKGTKDLNGLLTTDDTDFGES
jgi:hypothetical protein